MVNRLPVPGSDNGTWGDILNTFLTVEHNLDGTLKIRADGSVAPLSGGKVPTSNLGGGTASSSNFLRGDGVWAVPNSGSSALANDTDVTLVNPTNNQALLYDNVAGRWTNQSIAQSDVTNLVADMASKEPAIAAGTTGQYYRGDKSFQTLDKTAVGLSTVDNTSDATKNAAIASLTNKTMSGASNTFSNIPESAITNLSSDLAAKATDANVVHIAGAETVTGAKDFTGRATINGTNIVVVSDSRLTDQRTPTDGSVTTAKIAAGGIAESAVTNLTSDLAAKATISSLAPVATSGSYTDLTNTPTIPAAQVNTDWSANSGVAQLLNKPSLATVATSGSYTDLSNKPTIPTLSDATISSKGIVQLAGDLGGTATAPTVPGLAMKLSTTTAASTYAPLASPTFTGTVTVPTPVNSTDATTKTYVDTQVSSAVSNGATPDATSSTKGKLQLAGDLGGTAAAPTVPGLAAKANTASLATVATSGSYTDLTNTPSVSGTNTGDQTLALSGSSLTISGLNGNGVNIPSAPAATTSTPGLVQLAGDLGGSATSSTAPVISDNAITSSKIANGAVTTSKLATGSVTSNEIADGTITNTDISSSAAIDRTKLDSSTQSSLAKADIAASKAYAIAMGIAL